MEYEWDTDKAEANKAKHGVSFAAAEGLDWSTAVLFPHTRHGERRVGALALIGDRLHYVVYVDRGHVRRVISLRKANSREVRRYLEV